jgi:orotate phosphoribosyltransferase
MDEYKKRLAVALAETGALFFDNNLVLKDGRPTPYFVNMAMFKTGRLCMELGSFFASMMVLRDLVKETDIIVGPSYKGSAIALATSIALWKDYGIDLPFDYDRKEAKTHGEASGSKSLFVNNTFFDGCRLFIVDDVATSMNTKYDLLKKIQDVSSESGMAIKITGIGIAIDRQQTTAIYDPDGNVVLNQKGKNAIQDFVSESGVSVYVAAGIKEVLQYIYEDRIPIIIHGKKAPLDETTKAEFDQYIETYGTVSNKVS